VLARGGGELSEIVVKAAEEGLLLQSWKEHFDPLKWSALFDRSGLKIAEYTGRFAPGKAMPWDAMKSKARADFLAQEYERALRGELTPDCRLECASDCGACDSNAANRVVSSCAETGDKEIPADGATPMPEAGEKVTALLVYEKNSQGRFIPYHDMVRLMERAIVGSGAQLCYSEGFSPQPRMSFTYPLSLGFTGLRELCKITLKREAGVDFMEKVNAGLPEGLRLRQAGPMKERGALETLIYGAEYEVALGPDAARHAPAVERFLIAAEFPADVEGKSGIRRIDIRPLLLGLTTTGTRLILRLALAPRATLRVADFLKSVLGLTREEIVLLPVCRNRFLMNGIQESES
jgi:radical SAM-linked protein